MPEVIEVKGEVKAGLKAKGWFEVRDKDGNLKQKGEITSKEEKEAK